jgi:hypothetical protein
VAAQAVLLRGQLGRLELGRLLWTTTRVVAASAALAAVAYVVWDALDDALGRSLVDQILSLGAGLTAGAAVYGAAVIAMRIPEAQQILALARRRPAA